MSKNLYRVGKKSDLDEIIKNNFFKPICIVFTSKEIEKEFEDKIANIFKEVSKKNTYCMYLLINLDNFIDNINFFNQMKINGPNFIAYFKGKQISGHSFIQDIDINKENYLSTIETLIDKINSSYVQRLVNLFNQNDQELNEKQNNKVNKDIEDNKVSEDIKVNKVNKVNEGDKEEEEEDDDKGDEDDEDNEEDDEDEDDEDDEDDENNDDNDDSKNAKKDDDVDKEEQLNNIKKRNIELDVEQVDVEQIEIDKKKEKLKELIKLKKNLKK
jgi:hypothetical protein